MAQLQPKNTMQRSFGKTIIGFKNRDGATVLDDLYQQGSAKVRFARPEPNRLTEAVLINTSGGMTGGDKFKIDIAWGEGTTSIVTTQAAERHYKSLGDVAKIQTNLKIGENACGLWLPQESIMFDGAAYERSTNIDMQENSKLLAVESSIFGRSAMGEIVNQGSLIERWNIRRNGRLIFADAFGLDGDISAKLNKPAVGAGALAISTIIYANDDNEQMRDEINAMIELHKAKGRATCFEGLMVVRLFASNSQSLRNIIIKILNKTLVKLTKSPDSETLLPRVWLM